MENVVLSQEEYRSLMKDSQFLACLEQAGVNNWNGYSEAWTIYNENYDN